MIRTVDGERRLICDMPPCTAYLTIPEGLTHKERDKLTKKWQRLYGLKFRPKGSDLCPACYYAAFKREEAHDVPD